MKYIIFLVIILFVFAYGIFHQESFVYTETIETGLQSDILWNMVEQSFVDSTQSKFIPSEYLVIKASKLQTDSTISITQKTALGATTNAYRLTYDQPGVIEYKSPTKRLPSLSAAVAVIPREKGSSLSWSTEYKFRTVDIRGWYLHYIFYPSFFRSMRTNLRQIQNFQGV